MKKIRIKLSVDNPYKATNPKTTSFHFRVNIRFALFRSFNFNGY